MVAITSAIASPPPATARPARSSPELDAQKRTYQAQLADWVTCPSAKTPEGKTKIAHISDKLESVKVQIKKSDGTEPSSTTQPRETQQQSAASKIESGDGLRAPKRPGALVDVYA